MKQVTVRESEPSVDRSISDLAFSEVPGQSELFLKYLDDPVLLRRFYPNAFASPADVAAYAPEVLSNYSVDRAAVCNRLESINLTVGAGPATFANIEKLSDPDCVAVFTGQQAGLLSGPLYTIYKALSAVKLAVELNEKGVKAVPVFWAATEDHDFEEVASVELIDNAGELQKFTWSAPEEAEGHSVGRIVLDSSVRSLIDSIIRSLGGSPFGAETADLLTDAWRPAAGFGESFGRTVMSLLGRFGLIYVDPLDTGLKKLASPMYASAVERADPVAASVTARGKELTAAGFHEQVSVDADYFPLFWHDDEGRRLALRKTNDGLYRSKEGKQAFTGGELATIARETPDRLSPGVMLRPVVQDYLFPTICYFGGGAEVSYFAQNSEVYRVLERPVTPIFHRQSFTVIESRQQRAFGRLGIGIEDLFNGEEAMRMLLAEKALAAGTAKLFADVEERINAELNRLDQAVAEIDSTVAVSLARRRQKIIYHIAATRRKALLAQIRNDEITDRRIREMFTTVLPNGALQERSLNVFQYYAKYGPAFIDCIYEAIDLNNKHHRLVRI